MRYDALHLDPGETVIFEVRKHWIVFVGFAIGLLFIAFVPFLVFIGLQIYLPALLNIKIPGSIDALFFFFYCLWLLVLWFAFFLDWTTYYLDVWYVTQKRIIIVDQRAVFDRKVSNVRFDKIQDISVEISGFISTFLGFGSIKVQTASEDNWEFTMHTVRHPHEVRRIIFSRHNEIEDNKATVGKV